MNITNIIQGLLLHAQTYKYQKAMPLFLNIAYIIMDPKHGTNYLFIYAEAIT